MSSIFYKNKSNGSSYKLTLFKDTDPEYVDQILDVIRPSNDNEFITEDEFKQAYDKTMEIDVMDEDSRFCIGKLETEWLYVDSLEENQTI